MAIGNPFGLSSTVTVGVVSYVGRHNAVMQSAGGARFQDFIQTDAAINQGNSGGPLLNVRGEVIGVNSMIYSNQGGGNVGVGFAIPINTVRDLLPQLREGKVTRGRIGVSIDPHPFTRDDAQELGLPSTGGALVSQLGPGPARDAGIRVGDVIVEFNGKTISSSDELVNLVTRTAPGTTVPVKVVRDKRQLTVNVRVAELDLAEERGTQNAGGRGGDDRQTPTEAGAFGLTLQNLSQADRRDTDLPAGQTGVLVTSVTPFGPAAQANVSPGDIILTIQGQPVRTAAEASRALDGVVAGRLARIVIWSNGQERLVQIRKQ
jgi:serine protease Do